MKQLLLVLASISLAPTLTAQTFDWVRPMGGTDADEGYGVDHRDDGGSYAIGMFNGTAQFGGSTLTSAGGMDMYLARLDAGGAVLWASRAGGLDDQGGHVLVDIGGAVVAAGEFKGSMDFSTGTLTATGGDRDLWVASYDPNGQLLWALQGQATGLSQFNSIAADANGYVVLAGRFEGTLQIGSSSVTSAGMQDVFVLRLSPGGNVDWLVRAGGTDDDDAKGLALLPDGSAVISGSYNGSAQFGANTVSAPGAAREIFAAKVDNLGGFVWAVSAGGAGVDQVYEVAADNSGSAYIAGFFTGQATFGPLVVTSAGGDDAFVAKVDGAGAFQWVTAMGGAVEDRVYALDVAAWGHVHCTGAYTGTATFGSSTFTSAGDNDLFVAALDGNGAVTWATTAGGSGFDRGYGLSSDGNGGVWVTGAFAGTATWGTQMHTSAGLADSFVAHLSAPVSVNEQILSTSLQVGPNPATDHVWVTLPSAISNGTEILLCDALGHVVSRHRSGNGLRQMISLSGLAKGVYVVRVGQQAAARVVKE